MSELQTVKVPDLGDSDAVEVIEVLVNDGDDVELETSLITVESDKASMEIPSPVAGRVTSVLVKVGDTVSTGSDIFVIDVASATTAAGNEATKATTEPAAAEPTPAPTPAAAQTPATPLGDDAYDVVVIGAGPGGYTARRCYTPQPSSTRPKRWKPTGYPLVSQGLILTSFVALKSQSSGN